MHHNITFTRHIKSLVGASALALTTSLAFSSVAQAQSSEVIDYEDGTSEVIVTVERREQSLQDYAGTAATLDGDDLKLLGVQNLNDIDGKIPGLSVANNQGNYEVYIRGVGSSNNTELGDPAAATHLDGVYLPRPAGIGAGFFDIQRVEVNIGPQGTLRGRNATAGSVNIIPWAPGIGVFDAVAEASVGNYNERSFEGMVNLPIGDKAAVRIAGYKLERDSYLESITPCSGELGLNVPTCEAEGVGVAEAADDEGLRISGVVEPIDNLRLSLTYDNLEQNGSGYTGVNYSNALGNGINPDDISNPRRVVGRAFTPKEDTEHTGLKFQAEYEFGDNMKLEYIAGMRDLNFDYEFVTPASVAYDGVLDNISNSDIDNFSRVKFITDSESTTHELRLVSDSEKRFFYTVGAFLFEEDQRTFLGTTGDRNPFFSGVEFNQFTDTESYSFYGDATYKISDDFRLTGGLRYTNDKKERFGVNARFGQAFIIGGDGFGCCFATGVGTEGFEFNGLGRTLFNPDVDGNGSLTPQEVLNFYFDGVRTPGARDGLLDVYANGEVVDPQPFGDRPLCPTLLIGFDGTSNGSCFSQPTADLFGNAVFDPLVGRVSFAVVVPQNAAISIQNGALDNDFTDYRLRAEYDLDEDHLVYGILATGTKSGGFNDNIDGLPSPTGTFNPAGGAPAEFSANGFAPTYDPEYLTMYEFGSKNSLEAAGIPMTLNFSGFYYDYADRQVTSLESTATIAEDEGLTLTEDQLAALGGNIVSRTLNLDARIAGVQLDSSMQFPGDLTLKASLLWLPVAELNDDTGVQDARYQADVDGVNAVQQNLNGNRLIRTPEVQLTGSVGKVWDVYNGQFDTILSYGYRSSQHMTIFNGIDYNLDDDVSARLDDKVDGYWTFDLGAGYTFDADGKYRLEGWMTNLTNEQKEQGIIITQFDNTRFFSRPRTYGLRLRVKY